MNVVFQEYIKGLGKRYSGCSVLKSNTVVCTLANKKQTFFVTEFIHKNELKQFWESGEVGFVSSSVKNVPSELLPEHKAVVTEIGIVSDLFNFADAYMRNVTDAFLCSVPAKSMEILLADLEQTCIENSVNMTSSIKLQDLHIFAYEANGNVFLYNAAGELFLYASDHNYSELSLVSGFPEFTLYRIKNMQTFDDFVKVFWNNFS